MANIEEKTAEVNKNFKVFKGLLPSIDPRHSGKFAVLRKEKIIDYFDSMSDAAKYADALYEDGLYSIQEVNAKVVDLGIFSRIGTDTSVSTLGQSPLFRRS